MSLRAVGPARCPVGYIPTALLSHDPRWDRPAARAADERRTSPLVPLRGFLTNARHASVGHRFGDDELTEWASVRIDLAGDDSSRSRRSLGGRCLPTR